MTDLRADLIDDIAEVFREAGHDEPFATQYATVCIDRGLDTLADRADEWRRAGEPHPEHSNSACWAHTHGLIAVLRGDT